MSYDHVPTVLHWNYRGFTEFPLQKLQGEEAEVVDIYLKENLISRIPSDICRLSNLESLYLSGNDITELPREISTLRSLKCLDISGNRLRFIPEEIAEAKKLKFLILDENELRQLPLRLAELRALRYLSVCDNKLKWLPQRPVYNYHHCEFRFWRNKELKTLPYSLWNHMFRDQQTRSLNIGCLSSKETCSTGKHITIFDRHRKLEYTVNIPGNYTNILDQEKNIPPSLFELSKRNFYQILCDTANKLNNRPYSVYMDLYTEELNNKKMANLEQHLSEFSIEKDLQNDINGNYETSLNNDVSFNKNRERIYVPSDFVREYYFYLPSFIKYDLNNGPVSRCENILCKEPVFDFVYLEFCVQKIILIDKTEDVTLSAAFCSKKCAELWKTDKNILKWEYK